VLSFWSDLARPWLSRQPTPFYLFSATPIEAALADLDSHLGHLPVRHWLSCKTQPLRPLLRWWEKRGRPIEVVSEFELRAALREGFTPERILVNGPAKHHWLPRQALRGLLVNFDSPTEAAVLAPLARRWRWTTGLRLHTRGEYDPEAPQHPTQFGLTPAEAAAALRSLRRCHVTPQIAHLHLRTNVASPALYEQALEEVARFCGATGFAPKFVDCGGGFPPPHVLGRDGARLDANFSLAGMAAICQRALRRFPDAAELWLENGRWLSARSGVLVVKILEVKERRAMRHLICDGGRTGQALVSTWEAHELIPIPAQDDSGGGAPAIASTDQRAVRRASQQVMTTVTGPTCMAFDQLARRRLPRSLRPGDHLLWLEAGAYHLPWETRFSHGLAAVLWHDGRRTRLVRPRERFETWWGQWT
jgi:diaminopimelate decarboxylase